MMVTENFGSSSRWIFSPQLVERRGMPVSFPDWGGIAHRSVLMHNQSEQVRECFRQAAECAQQSNVQTDPKLERQFLMLARLWLILAERLDLKSPTNLWTNSRGEQQEGEANRTGH